MTIQWTGLPEEIFAIFLYGQDWDVIELVLTDLWSRKPVRDEAWTWPRDPTHRQRIYEANESPRGKRGGRRDKGKEEAQ